MNLWITKISKTGFSETERSNFAQITSDKFSQPFETFEHKTPDIHFLSFSKNQANNKVYNYINNNSELFSYSGIVIDTHETPSDYRNAQALANKNSDLSDLANELCGQFALVSINKNEFRCVVDNLGVYKVFYFIDSQKNIYISNHLAFIQSVKKPEINFDFLINFIANGGTYGYETIENNVFVMPESGEFRWNKTSGHIVKRYLGLAELFKPTDSDPIENTGKKLQNISSYLTKFHDVLIPLSGGYDSRLILNMFWGKYSNNVTAYSYLDHPYDFKTAKKLSKKYGIDHVELKPGNIPDIHELHEFSQKLYPFICYSSVFKYVFHEYSHRTIYNSEKVELWGNGGAIDMGIDVFGGFDNIKPGKSFELFAKKKANSKILTKDAYERSYKNVKNFYTQKYAPIYDEVNNFNLPTAHYMFERFASYQGQRYCESFSDSSKVNYLPYANKQFVQLVLSADTKLLLRRKKGGIHHQLSDYLTDKKAPTIPFVKSLHWNATTIDKATHYLKRDYLDLIFKKMNLMKDKYANQVRNSFYDKYEHHFKEVIYSHPNSTLWDYIDYKKVKGALQNADKNNKRRKNLKLLFRVIPHLKDGI